MGLGLCTDAKGISATQGAQQQWEKRGTHSSGLGDVQRGVTDDAVAHQAVPREEAAGVERGNQHLGAFREDPLH